MRKDHSVLGWRALVVLSLAAALLVVAGFGDFVGGQVGGPTAQAAPEITGVTVEHPWMRPALAGMSTAVYATLHNATDEPVEIVAVESEVAGRSEMHRTIIETTVTSTGIPTQMMKMEPVKSYVIPAGGSFVLEPGGAHIMLLELKRDLVIGEQIHVRLISSKGSSVEVVATVGELGDGEDHHHHHDHHHHGEHDHHDGHDHHQDHHEEHHE